MHNARIQTTMSKLYGPLLAPFIGNQCRLTNHDNNNAPYLNSKFVKCM